MIEHDDTAVANPEQGPVMLGIDSLSMTMIGDGPVSALVQTLHQLIPRYGTITELRPGRALIPAIQVQRAVFASPISVRRKIRLRERIPRIHKQSPSMGI